MTNSFDFKFIVKVYKLIYFSLIKMDKDEQLRASIMLFGGSGQIPEDEAHAMLNSLSTGSLFRSVPSEADKALGKNRIYQTLDVNGEALVSGTNYQYGDKKIKVLREEFGSGNMLDVYMRVYFIDDSLEERCTVIDGSYPGGVFKGAVYNSLFEPIKKE